MKVRAQASAPAAAGSHDTIAFRFFVTAVVASVSATVMYCSASAGETCSAVALLSKPSLNSSVGKVLAGPVASVSRAGGEPRDANAGDQLVRSDLGLHRPAHQIRDRQAPPPLRSGDEDFRPQRRQT
jgi:hypothetical protein